MIFINFFYAFLKFSFIFVVIRLSQHMFIRKYRLFIVIAFLGVFASKMVISGAPIIFSVLDKGLMNSVIMQLEVERSGDDTQKIKLTFSDQKLSLERYDLNIFYVNFDCGVSNSFIEHHGRYVDPFHPSVPTPPPNFS